MVKQVAIAPYSADEIAGWKSWCFQNAASGRGGFKNVGEIIEQLEVKVAGYEKWFSDNAAVLASHGIGGFKFGA